MSGINATQRLFRAKQHGQEVVANPDKKPVSWPLTFDVSRGIVVTYQPRYTQDSHPWTDGTDHFSGTQCTTRLVLPLAAGTVLRHTTTKERGLYAGPAQDKGEDFVSVEWHDGHGIHLRDEHRTLLFTVKE